MSGLTPTKAGEGETTTAASLTQGLGAIGRVPLLCLREPSLGPVFGVKGGAAGGGLAQVVPMEDLNPHFTGDIHAVGAANNLLGALLDASILHGNPHSVDAPHVASKRALDMNERGRQRARDPRRGPAARRGRRRRHGVQQVSEPQLRQSCHRPQVQSRRFAIMRRPLRERVDGPLAH